MTRLDRAIPRHLAPAAATAALLLLMAPAPSRAQDGPRPLPPELLEGGPSPEEELRRLFREVEQTLRGIDDQLFDAAAGEADLGAVDAEIDRLLRATEDSSRSAVEGIDQILQVAQQMNQQRQGGSGDQQQQSPSGDGSGQDGQEGGQSPLDGQQSPERQQRMEGERAPDPGTDPSGQDQPRPDQAGERPEDGRESSDEGRNSAGDEARRGERGAGSSPTGADRWGDLPPRVQSIFQNQVNDDLPVRYRDWIDRYHRRLNG